MHRKLVMKQDFFFINLPLSSLKHFLSAHQSSWAVQQTWLVLFLVKTFVTAINIVDLWLFSSGSGYTHR